MKYDLEDPDFLRDLTQRSFDGKIKRLKGISRAKRSASPG